MTQAADNLYTTQPNLSKAVKKLEADLGMAIFKRTPKGLLPTKQGADFLERARSILEQVDQLEAVSYTHLDVYKRQGQRGVLLPGDGGEKTLQLPALLCRQLFSSHRHRLAAQLLGIERAFAPPSIRRRAGDFPRPVPLWPGSQRLPKKCSRTPEYRRLAWPPRCV